MAGGKPREWLLPASAASRPLPHERSECGPYRPSALRSERAPSGERSECGPLPAPYQQIP
jgi:hypothetical protein